MGSPSCTFPQQLIPLNNVSTFMTDIYNLGFKASPVEKEIGLISYSSSLDLWKLLAAGATLLTPEINFNLQHTFISCRLCGQCI